jgi:molybdenum-dependent DNA-binding transcriptional regulator ModE
MNNIFETALRNAAERAGVSYQEALRLLAKD